MARSAARPRWAAALMRWYRRHARPLPWRQTRDPYAIWVSEVMLQQTTVATVGPYYERFLRSFPTVEALAAASEDEVVSLWSGLGYYRRARQLRQAAQVIMERHAGVFPADSGAARSLPGVGRYTSGAVLSIAYDLRLPIVDGNVRRVLLRVHGITQRDRQTEAALYAIAESILPRARSGAWNQALMDLGATCCTPANPACPECPVRDACVARARGLQRRIPPQRPRRTPMLIKVSAALVVRDGRVLLCRPTAQGSGPLRRLWEVPHTGLDRSRRRSVAAALLERYGIEVCARPGPPLGVVRHSVTFRRLAIDVTQADLLEQPSRAGVEIAWVDPRSSHRLPMAALTRKILALTPATQRAVPR